MAKARTMRYSLVKAMQKERRTIELGAVLSFSRVKRVVKSILGLPSTRESITVYRDLIADVFGIVIEDALALALHCGPNARIKGSDVIRSTKIRDHGMRRLL